MKNNSICIRKASLDDAETLLKIYSFYVEKTAISFECQVPTVSEFKGRMAQTLSKYPYIVAVKDNQIMGYSYLNPFKSRCAYDWAAETTIYVRQDATHEGLGKMLYDTLESIAIRQNIINLYACIAYPETEDEYLTKNSAQFHSHMGYEMAGHYHKCGYKFGRWYDMVYMEKSLTDHLLLPDKIIPFNELVPQFTTSL